MSSRRSLLFKKARCQKFILLEIIEIILLQMALDNILQQTGSSEMSRSVDRSSMVNFVFGILCITASFQ